MTEDDTAQPGPSEPADDYGYDLVHEAATGGDVEPGRRPAGSGRAVGASSAPAGRGETSGSAGPGGDNGGDYGYDLAHDVPR